MVAIRRHGLVVGTLVGPAAGGRTEVEQATTLLTALHAEQPQRAGRRTVGADRGYATADFLAVARGLGFTPHVAQTDADRGRVFVLALELAREDAAQEGARVEVLARGGLDEFGQGTRGVLHA